MTSDMVTWDDVIITERTDQKVKKLTTDQPYHFRVIAFNDIGESKPLDSDEVICRIPKGKAYLFSYNNGYFASKFNQYV